MDSSDNKCPKCKESITFDSVNQVWFCNHCKSEFLDKDIQKNQAVTPVKIYHCDNCCEQYATVNSEFNCIYCGNNLNQAAEEFIKPDYIKPFVNNKNDAIKVFKKMLKNRIFYPNILKKSTIINNIKGVYVPFWIYNFEINGKVTFLGMDEVNNINSKYEITNDCHFEFVNYMISASKNFPNNLIDSLELYNYSDLTEYDDNYLAEYAILQNSINEEESFDKIKSEAMNVSIGKVRKAINHNKKKLHSNNMEITNINKKCVLLPIWIVSVIYNDKNYILAMNDFNGKTFNNVPTSMIKTIVLSIIIFIIYFVIGLIVMKVLGG